MALTSYAAWRVWRAVEKFFGAALLLPGGRMSLLCCHMALQSHSYMGGGHTGTLTHTHTHTRIERVTKLSRQCQEWKSTLETVQLARAQERAESQQLLSAKVIGGNPSGRGGANALFACSLLAGYTCTVWGNLLPHMITLVRTIKVFGPFVGSSILHSQSSLQ